MADPLGNNTPIGNVTAVVSGTVTAVISGGSLQLLAGTANIGNVGGKTISTTLVLTVTTSTTYGVNFVMGGLLTFTSAFGGAGSGILQSVAITMQNPETSGFTFIPFHANPTASTFTDATVAAINTADCGKMREPVPLNLNSQLGTCTIAYANGLGIAMSPGTTTMWGLLIANATLTNAFANATAVNATIKILQDL